MDYYRLADGTLVGTQADARKSKQKWEPHTVPTDKAGLMTYVNAIKIAQKPIATLDSPIGTSDDTGATPAAPDSPARDRLRSTLAGIDAPEGVDVNKIGEVILKSSGYVLASFAEAVAMRYGMLAKSRKEA